MLEGDRRTGLTCLHFILAHILVGSLLQLLAGLAFLTVRLSMLHLITSTSLHPSPASGQEFTFSLLQLG